MPLPLHGVERSLLTVKRELNVGLKPAVYVSKNIFFTEQRAARPPYSQIGSTTICCCFFLYSATKTILCGILRAATDVSTPKTARAARNRCCRPPRASRKKLGRLRRGDR